MQKTQQSGWLRSARRRAKQGDQGGGGLCTDGQIHIQKHSKQEEFCIDRERGQHSGQRGHRVAGRWNKGPDYLMACVVSCFNDSFFLFGITDPLCNVGKVSLIGLNTF